MPDPHDYEAAVAAYRAQATDEVDRLRQRVAELEAALRPFADEGCDYSPTLGDSLCERQDCIGCRAREVLGDG